MVTILAAADGIGMMITAPIIFLFQFIIIVIATFARGALSDSFITEIAILGGFMVAASGLSLLNIKDLKAANMMPALLIPIIFFAVKGIFNI